MVFILWIRSNRITFIRIPTPTLPIDADLNWAYLTAFYYYYDYVTSGSVGISAHSINVSGWEESTLTWNDVCDACKADIIAHLEDHH